MIRRLSALLAVLAVALLGVTPSHAATKPKKKPNIVGKYDVTLYPDPTEDATNAVMPGCTGLTGKGTDSHPFTVPAAGRLTVHLVSPDPTGLGARAGAGTDWDLWVMGTDGSTYDSSVSATSDEQTITTFKKKTSVIIQVCNIMGEPSGHISYIFKYA